MVRVAALLLYVAAPFLILRARRKWSTAAAILALWLPIELRLFPAFGVDPALAIVCGMLAGVFAFRSRSDVFNASAAFDLRKLEFREAIVNFALFAVLAIPIGLAIGFIEPSIHLPDLRSAPGLVASIFFLNALPEEILFRGIIQHAATSWLKTRSGGLIVSALIFGAAHLNNGPSAPNYKYFVMATLAGLFYGRAWQRHRNVLTSTVTHALVNTGGRLFLR